MPNQQVYLNNENYSKLKKEENMSRLINQLLSEYFLNHGLADNEKAVIDQVKNILANKEEEVKKAESRREMVIRLFKKHHGGLEPNEDEIQENLRLLEKVKESREVIQQ
jgi:hypothetical protein